MPMLTNETLVTVEEGDDTATAMWGEVLAANDEGDEEVIDAGRQLQEKGYAVVGGGAAAEVFVYLADIKLPEGWTWKRVMAERQRWGLESTMVPIARVPGVCFGWGTINSVLREAEDARALRAEGRY